VHLQSRSDQTPSMMDHRDMFELHDSCACYRIQRLAGGVRNEVKVHAVCGHTGSLAGISRLGAGEYGDAKNHGDKKRSHFPREAFCCVYPSAGEEANLAPFLNGLRHEPPVDQSRRMS
jgi:hypothetical protein